MFVCRECQDKNGCYHLAVSYGGCEICGRIRECGECKHSHRREITDDEILRESGGEEPSAHLAAQQFNRYGRTGSDILALRGKK